MIGYLYLEDFCLEILDEPVQKGTDNYHLVCRLAEYIHLLIKILGIELLVAFLTKKVNAECASVQVSLDKLKNKNKN